MGGVFFPLASLAKQLRSPTMRLFYRLASRKNTLAEIDNLSFTRSYTGTRYQELEDQIIADLERNHFQLIRVGWADDTRCLDIKLQFDIKPDGKIWIQENLTDTAVDDELLKRGVPATDIVLGMQPPSYRQFSEFAVG